MSLANMNKRDFFFLVMHTVQSSKRTVMKRQVVSIGRVKARQYARNCEKFMSTVSREVGVDGKLWSRQMWTQSGCNWKYCTYMSRTLESCGCMRIVWTQALGQKKTFHSDAKIFYMKTADG